MYYNNQKNNQNNELYSHRYNRKIYSPTLKNKNIDNFYENN